METINHIFFSYGMAVDLWSLFATWWELDIPIFSSISDWVPRIDQVRLADNVKGCLDAACLTIFWFIWCFRNRLLFSNHNPIKS